MTIEAINLGTEDNDGTGDSLKAGGAKINANFEELDGRVAVPAGGLTGQVLAKATDVNGEIEWVDPPAPGGSDIPLGGTTGQVLAKASAVDGDVEWVDQTVIGQRPATVQVHRSTNLSVAHATWTFVPFDVVSLEDVPSAADLVTHSTRLTVPAGYTKARLSAGLVWFNNDTDNRWAHIKKNGTSTDVALDIRKAVNESPQNMRSQWLAVVEGDYFEVEVRQQSGSALNLAGASAYGGPAWFMIELCP